MFLPLCSSRVPATYIYVYLSITVRYPGDMWIGLNDTATEGTAVWSDGSTNFTSGIQNNAGYKNCVFMDSTFEWFYVQCREKKVVICQGKYNIM